MNIRPVAFAPDIEVILNNTCEEAPRRQPIWVMHSGNKRSQLVLTRTELVLGSYGPERLNSNRSNP